MSRDTVDLLRKLLFWLNEHIPQMQELWMFLLNVLANYG